MISLSASGRSKGERLVSASAAMKKMTKAAKPHGEKTNQFPARLHAGDFGGVEAADHHHHNDCGKHERDFVADHLRDGAHAAEQRVLVARGPAGHEDCKRVKAGDGEKENDRAIEQVGFY